MSPTHSDRSKSNHEQRSPARNVARELIDSDGVRRGIAARVASGLAWTAGAFAGVRFLGIAQTVVLARLLSPSDFGMYAMISLATGTLNLLTSMGIGEAVIQSRHEVRATLDSAFCLNLVRGVVLYVAIFLVAPWIEQFFVTPGLATLLRIAGLTLLLGAANNVGPILFSKELDYRRASLYAQSPLLVSTLVSIGLAIWLRNVWALVLSQLAAAMVMLPLSYWIHPFRPRFRLDREASRHLIRYGANIFGSSPLFYVSNHIDELVVGRRFGSRTLGAYQLAYNTSALPAMYLSELVMSVLFPVLARLQLAPAMLREAYLKTLRHLANVSLPLSALLFAFAPEFIRVVYGTKWETAAPLLMAFSVYGTLRSLMTISLQVFKATGHTRLILQLAALNLGTVVWVVLIGAPYGPIWIAALLSAVSVPAAAYGFDLTGRILQLPLKTIARACVPAMVSTAIALVLVLAARSRLAGVSNSALRAGAGSCIFGVVYLPLLLLLDRAWVTEILAFVRAGRSEPENRAAVPRH